ncbi:MAG: site-2 protease family protein [Firmicutes bacterium]|nr:site-2 protease family protein [Bacillota bacterium]
MTFSRIIVSLLVLDVLIIVHELGHFLSARLFGVRVKEFGVGFGPILLRMVRHGIVYSLRAVPFGGFVLLAGAETVPMEEKEEEPGPDDFGRQPTWKKSLIVLAGPLNNLLLAAFVLILTFALVGIPVAMEKQAVIGFVDPKTPAYEAGLTAGDRVVTVNGKEVATWEELAKAIRQSGGGPIVLLVEREGRRFLRTLKPFFDPQVGGYRVGISPRYIFKRLDPWTSFVTGIKYLFALGVGLVQTGVQIVLGQARAPLAGPIGTIGTFVESFQAGPWWFLYLVASINLFLAFFNLLPIPLPLLDGGWVVIYLLERIRRREFTAEQKAAAQLFGLVVLLTFFLFVTYGDVVTGIRRFLNR